MAASKAKKKTVKKTVKKAVKKAAVKKAVARKAARKPAPRRAASVRSKVSAVEWAARVELAAAFRMAYHLGWNDRLVNHITARVPDQPDLFLMNPHGLGWHEITASCLVKADFKGNIKSDADASLAPAGLNFHSAILAAKSGVNCVCHTHPTAGVVISATRGGLKIHDQTGCLLHGQLGYHDFEGYAREEDEAPRIIRDLGEGKALIMRNHGLLTVGRDIGEAFAYMRRLIYACELHERILATGVEINEIPQEVLDRTLAQTAQRRPNQPYGGPEWQMTRRMADALYPDHRN